MKPFIDKFDAIVNGLDQWQKENDAQKNNQLNKLSVLQNNQTKER